MMKVFWFSKYFSSCILGCLLFSFIIFTPINLMMILSAYLLTKKRMLSYLVFCFLIFTLEHKLIEITTSGKTDNLSILNQTNCPAVVYLIICECFPLYRKPYIGRAGTWGTNHTGCERYGIAFRLMIRSRFPDY